MSMLNALPDVSGQRPLTDPDPGFADTVDAGDDRHALIKR